MSGGDKPRPVRAALAPVLSGRLVVPIENQRLTIQSVPLVFLNPAEKLTLEQRADEKWMPILARLRLTTDDGGQAQFEDRAVDLRWHVLDRRIQVLEVIPLSSLPDCLQLPASGLGRLI